MHPPAQGLLQHTPSTQKPVAHWQLELQEAPFGWSATQVVPEHQAFASQVAGQPPDGAQVVLQAPAPLHVFRPHAFSGSVFTGRFVQVPKFGVRLHATQPPRQALLQQNPSTQLPDVHSIDEPQVLPCAFFGAQVVTLQYSVEAHPFTSAGQDAPSPVQFSAMVSHAPPGARHWTPFARN